MTDAPCRDLMPQLAVYPARSHAAEEAAEAEPAPAEEGAPRLIRLQSLAKSVSKFFSPSDGAAEPGAVARGRSSGLRRCLGFAEPDVAAAEEECNDPDLTASERMPRAVSIAGSSERASRASTQRAEERVPLGDCVPSTARLLDADATLGSLAVLAAREHLRSSRLGEAAAATRIFKEATTADDYQMWPHGFVTTATLHHCRAVLSTLANAPASSLEQLRPDGSTGHIAIMLRTLCAVGWVTSQDGRYTTSASVAACAECPTLASLCEDVYGGEEDGHGDTSRSGRLVRLAKWLPSISAGWELPCEAAEVRLLPTMLAGAVVAPLLLELRMLSSSFTAKAHEGKHEHASASVCMDRLDADTAAAIGNFFALQGWGSYAPADRLMKLNETGLFILERRAQPARDSRSHLAHSVAERSCHSLPGAR